MESNKQTFALASNPFFELLTFIFVWLLCTLFGGVLLRFFMRAYGWADFSSILTLIQAATDGEAVNHLRYIQMVGHLFNYLIPSLIFMTWWHRRHAWKELQLDRAPSWKNLCIALIAVFVLFPFVSWLYYWNTHLIPEDWVGKDKLAMQEAFLKMRNGYELFLNILLLGVLAALGEELVFRGIIQRILLQWSKNEHLSAFITAALFSFIHFQWEGFISRFILGLLFCYLLIYTQNLWIPIIMHFIFNSVQVVIPYFYSDSINQIGEVKAVPIVAAVISFILFSVVWKLFLLNNNYNNNYKTK